MHAAVGIQHESTPKYKSTAQTIADSSGRRATHCSGLRVWFLFQAIPRLN